MIAMTLAQAGLLAGGRLVDLPPGLADERVAGVVTDSRLAGPQQLFVAIPGERVDGHDFVPQALANGALAALVSRPVAGPSILVEDTIAAMGRLAARIRTDLANCRVIAITGSSGKTSTKDLMAAVLGTAGPTVAPEGSFNTEVGVPMTVFRASEDTAYLVLEMGMRGRGHILTLCQIARPEIGIILNAGTAHLGLMGSRQAIVEAKSEILDLLPGNGTAILPGDDPALMAQAQRTAARILTFGEGPEVDVRADQVRLDEHARATFMLTSREGSAQVRLQGHGRHHVANSLAVAAACLSLGLSLEWTADAISAAAPRSKWRMEVHRGANGITVVNDAYNANPDSMRAALGALADMKQTGQPWAVLGQMLELGEASAGAHAEIGRHAAALGIRIICVGPGTEPMCEAAAEAHGTSDWVPDADSAVDLISSQLGGADTVLVKASRGVGLERVAQRLIELADSSQPAPLVPGGAG